MAIPALGHTYCTAYSYFNRDYGNNCTLYIMEQPLALGGDLISFSSAWGITEFHGSVRNAGRGMLDLEFNFKGPGPTRQLRHVRLMRIADHPPAFEGFDYKGRHISMQEMKRWYWRQELGLWTSL